MIPTEALLSLILIVLMIAALMKEMLRPGLILLTVLGIFYTAGIIDVTEFLSGFSNKGMFTIALLFLISEGIKQTGGLSFITQFFLPKRKYHPVFMLGRIMLPATFLSAFINNTPVVVILAPAIKNWAKRLNVSPSRFLIPLSYATIFGGMCTLIGTSTNLVVHGLMLQSGYKGLGMFELASIGIPIAVLGTLYTTFIGYHLLPENSSPEEALEKNPKKYLIEMELQTLSPLCGKSVEKAGLRALHGVFLMAIERENYPIENVNKEEILLAGDRLIFSGNVDSIDDLKSFPGLIIVEEQKFHKDFQNITKNLVEVVVSPRFPGLGKTIRDFNFRSTYRAAVLAVHRNGERIKGKIGDISLRRGDNLILLTTPRFTSRWKNSQDFYMVSNSGEVVPVQTGKALFSFALLVLMVLGSTLNINSPVKGLNLDMFFFALLTTLLMIWTKCFESRNYTRYISWDVLITIASAFGISKALINSGAATLISDKLIQLTIPFGPSGVLAGIFILTLIFTEVITNNAAAALMFPIAVETAALLKVSPRPLFIAIAIAASASFSTPIGYQTNLIVKGIGNYRFRDFLRIGLPLNLITATIAIILIPHFWTF